MSPDDLAPDPELSLALLQRNGLARSLRLHTRCRARTLALSRFLRTLSQLGTALARHRPADDDGQLPRFLLEAARRVRERALAGDEPPGGMPDT